VATTAFSGPDREQLRPPANSPKRKAGQNLRDFL
jgi:hypothetical protein